MVVVSYYVSLFSIRNINIHFKTHISYEPTLKIDYSNRQFSCQFVHHFIMYYSILLTQVFYLSAIFTMDIVLVYIFFLQVLIIALCEHKIIKLFQIIDLCMLLAAVGRYTNNHLFLTQRPHTFRIAIVYPILFRKSAFFNLKNRFFIKLILKHTLE